MKSSTIFLLSILVTSVFSKTIAEFTGRTNNSPWIGTWLTKADQIAICKAQA